MSSYSEQISTQATSYRPHPHAIVVVTGSRNIGIDHDERWAVMDAISEVCSRVQLFGGTPDVAVFTGDASGVDAVAADWAEKRKVPLLVFKADWDAHGKAAGPIRNRAMVDQAKKFADHRQWALLGVVIGIKDKSRGTADCAKRLRDAGAEMFEIWVDEEAKP